MPVLQANPKTLSCCRNLGVEEPQGRVLEQGYWWDLDQPGLRGGEAAAARRAAEAAADLWD